MTVRLPEETYEELAARADRLGMAPGVLARAYIKESVEDRDDLSPMVRSSVGEPRRDRRSKKGKGR